MNWAEQIDRNGYAIIHEVLEEAEVRNSLEELNGKELQRSRAGIRHLMREPVVAQIAQRGEMMRIAREIVGAGAVPFRVTRFDKPPASNWPAVWHQDTALPLREKQEADGWGPRSVKDGVTYAHAPAEALQQIVVLRLHLDDSKPGNGPLRVLQGTHKSGVLTDEPVHDLSLRINAVDCTVQKEGVLVMRPLVIHASSKSITEESRRVLHIE